MGKVYLYRSGLFCFFGDGKRNESIQTRYIQCGDPPYGAGIVGG